jgi:hypothetical protein
MVLRGRAASLAFVALAAFVSGGSCSSREEQAPVPASPGAQQPSAGGKALGEDEACKLIRDAEEAARKRLNCEPLNRTECPYYVRPAGTGCWTFDESSVSHCAEAIGAYELCSEFTQAPCIVTAQAADAASCPPFPGEGEGGQAGMNGSGGSGGRAGRGGNGGRAGSGARAGNAGAAGDDGNAGTAGG